MSNLHLSLRLKTPFLLASAALFAGLAASAALAGCSGAESEPGGGGPDDVGVDDTHGEETAQLEEGFSVNTVAQAAESSCSTASVKGLSFQIIEEGNCLSPGAYAPLSLPPNASASPNVFLFLEQPARDKLAGALNANPGKHLSISSMLRTVAQQFLLYRWYQTGRCGISLAAKPGNSNHETGLAIDVSEYSAWKSVFTASGFKWLGSADPWHFDYVGAGAVSHKGLDVKAFQRLWNRNNPGDKISEDGAWGPATEARMKASPANGFATGAQCGAPMGGGGEPMCKAIFKDICGSIHQASIEWLAAEGLTKGCGDGTKFCPDQVVSRGQMATFLAAALDLPPGPDMFTDDEGSPHEDAINAIAAAGITAGCTGDGTSFCPENPVSRAQMATFLTKAFKLGPGPEVFVDDQGSVHEQAINSIAAARITLGCDAANKLYCPENSVTRGQMATFLHKAMK